MNVNHDDHHSVSSRCSGSNTAASSLWIVQRHACLLAFFVTLAAFPATVSAVPYIATNARVIDGLHPRGQNDSNNGSNGSISMNVWLPILLVSVVFILFSLGACLRRCAMKDASASMNQTRTTPVTNTANPPRSRRRRRTPSQMSTKSLPPYMKEPGEQELVLFRGPLESEDEQVLPHGMATLAESDEEGDHPEMRNATFDVPLERVESMDTMPDASTTNLMSRLSASLSRPPELHHTPMPHHHHPSTDAPDSLGSIGSQSELLAAHQRGLSMDGYPDPRGRAPSYTEAVSNMTTISLNDPQTDGGGVIASPSNTANAGAGRGRSRFSFLLTSPFGSRNDANGSASNIMSAAVRTESPGPHHRSGSALSRLSSRDSHETHHSRTASRNNHLSRSHTRSNSNLYRVFRSHSPGPAGSSTISLDDISAPLTHTLTHAAFHAPKGGLTAEQIKLITSREALERFGVPYGPDAVAAFQLSRERLAEMGPPPDFESVTGEQREGPGTATSESSAAEAGVGSAAERSADSVDPDLDRAPVPSNSTSLSSRASDDHPGSAAVSYTTARESEEDHDRAKTGEVHVSNEGNGVVADADDPHTLDS